MNVTGNELIAAALFSIARLGREETLAPSAVCTGRWKGCVRERGHEGDCLDANSEPARWGDPTYLGDGPWGP